MATREDETKKTTSLIDCFGWPLPKPSHRIKSSVLKARADIAIKRLESLAVSGDVEAMREFELLLALMGKKYLHLLLERAKTRGTSFNGQSVIEQLLWAADDTIECLGWVAKNRSKACERFAEKRLTWPGYISPLRSIESKSQALKDYIPLGREDSYHPKIVADKVFKAARNIIKYLRYGDDWKASFCFMPFKWMERDEYRAAMLDFRQRQGPLTRSNWPRWKPICERCITLFYGPSRERWKLIPDLPMPKKFQKKYSAFTPLTYKDDPWIAARVGVTNEWLQHQVTTHKPTPAEKIELQNMLKRLVTDNLSPSIMDIEPDDTLKGIARRAENRDGGWGDYKRALLLKCKNLLPN